MSTTIYNGYCLPNMDLMNLKLFCNELDVQRKNVLNEIVKEYFFKICISFVDNIILYPNSNDFGLDNNLNDTNLFSNLFFKFINQIKKDSESKEYSLFDLSMTICFIPTNDKILALLYCNNKKLIELFENNKLVSEYCYYDNTDRPNDISYSDWRKRGIEWDNALTGIRDNVKGYAKPCDVGLIYKPDLFSNLTRIDRDWNILFSEYPDIINKSKRSESFLRNQIDIFKKYEKDIDVVERFCNVFEENFGIKNYFSTEDEIRNFFQRNIINIDETLFGGTEVKDVKERVLNYYKEIINDCKK